jgi:hypothetical protein
VESTLILSRKDGSIIKAKGFPDAPQRPRASSTLAYSTDPITTGDINSAGNQEGAVENDTVPAPSPPEQLASSIFDFVKSASALGLTLCEVSAEEEDDSAGFRRSQPAAKPTAEQKTSDVTDKARDESQVQLLRLRIKRREIIVFPDPQYLCCVVQRVGKQGPA